MAATEGYNGKPDLWYGTDRGGSTGDSKKTGGRDCSDQKKGTDADGLSGADHEIYASGTGRLNCQKGISENRL